MNDTRDALLQPSLADRDTLVAAPYSVQTTFFTGFFGGPFAALALFGINSLRLKRGGRDASVLIACLLFIILGAWFIYLSPAGTPVQAWLTDVFGERSRRYLSRFVALLIVGVAYLMHRSEQRNADLLGIDRPNGWIAGIACAIGGSVVLLLLGAMIVRLQP